MTDLRSMQIHAEIDDTGTVREMLDELLGLRAVADAAAEYMHGYTIGDSRDAWYRMENALKAAGRSPVLSEEDPG